MTTDNERRGATASRRIGAIGITKSEFAERAGIDRTTLDRVLRGDAKVSERTWGKVERLLDELDHVIGMPEACRDVTSTVTYQGATITVVGNASDVAETIRRVLGDD